ncbi:MAG: CPBP family intramembrane glutamic endopeptidase [Candidatus Cyclobacteriaceae bacterium M3_2C_046]
MITKKPIWLWPEFIIVFIALPLIQKFKLIEIRPVFILVGIALLFAFVLIKDKSFPNRRFYQWGTLDWKKHVIWFLAVTMLVSLFIYFFRHRLFLEFPMEKTQKYLLALVLYPVLSVIPQEIIFRAYYYHRYKSITNNKMVAILINSLAFGFLHIIYDNWLAPVGAFLISFIFSLTYLKTRSLPVVVIEHYFYGIMIFTIGLGHYFK